MVVYWSLKKKGKLQLFDPKTIEKIEVKGIPKVAYGGQGGLGDIALHPQFEQNHIIYLSYAEAGQGGLRGCGGTWRTGFIQCSATTR